MGSSTQLKANAPVLTSQSSSGMQPWGLPLVFFWVCRISVNALRTSYTPDFTARSSPNSLMEPSLGEKGSNFIGVFFGCVGRKIDGPGLPGGLIIYQGNPSICPKRTPIVPMASPGSAPLAPKSSAPSGGDRRGVPPEVRLGEGDL